MYSPAQLRKCYGDNAGIGAQFSRVLFSRRGAKSAALFFRSWMSSNPNAKSRLGTAAQSMAKERQVALSWRTQPKEDMEREQCNLQADFLQLIRQIEEG